MDGRMLYDETTRRRAAALFEEGMGYKAVASLLGIPRETVRKWLDVYRSVGIEVLAMMGKKHTGIASPSSFKKWLKAYREEGPEALKPKPKGRPRGSGSPPKETTREQELERRIQKLEAENAYLKKSIALKAEKRSRTARRRPS